MVEKVKILVALSESSAKVTRSQKSALPGAKAR
jgi:hypothetical protein